MSKFLLLAEGCQYERNEKAYKRKTFINSKIKSFKNRQIKPFVFSGPILVRNVTKINKF